VALSNAVIEATKCVSNSCPCAFVAGVSPTEPASCRQLEHTVADATWGRLSVTLSEPHSPFCLFSTWTITVWRWHSEVCKVIWQKFLAAYCLVYDWCQLWAVCPVYWSSAPATIVPMGLWVLVLFYYWKYTTVYYCCYSWWLFSNCLSSQHIWPSHTCTTTFVDFTMLDCWCSPDAKAEKLCNNRFTVMHRQIAFC